VPEEDCPHAVQGEAQEATVDHQVWDVLEFALLFLALLVAVRVDFLEEVFAGFPLQ
jgi:hypothetical protein